MRLKLVPDNTKIPFTKWRFVAFAFSDGTNLNAWSFEYELQEVRSLMRKEDLLGPQSASFYRLVSIDGRGDGPGLHRKLRTC